MSSLSRNRRHSIGSSRTGHSTTITRAFFITSSEYFRFGGVQRETTRVRLKPQSCVPFSRPCCSSGRRTFCTTGARWSPSVRSSSLSSCTQWPPCQTGICTLRERMKGGRRVRDGFGRPPYGRRRLVTNPDRKEPYKKQRNGQTLVVKLDSPILLCSVDYGGHLQFTIYLWSPVLLQFHLLLESHTCTHTHIYSWVNHLLHCCLLEQELFNDISTGFPLLSNFRRESPGVWTLQPINRLTIKKISSTLAVQISSILAIQISSTLAGTAKGYNQNTPFKVLHSGCMTSSA